ncbi:MAG: alpha/beta fold hydrolase [Candidatus Binatia bacterium]
MPNVKLSSGVDLYYETSGSGEPLVLVPSTGFSAEAWKPAQLPLAKSTNLILHDPRGCGRSVATQQVYSIQQMANDIVALLDHLKIPVAHLVGHSMGGRIALELALDFPGRVKSLIMAASGSGQAPRPGADCIPGLPHWLVIRLVEKGFEKALREEYCDTSAFFTDDYRKNNPEKIEAFFQSVWPTHAKLSEYIHLIIARHNWEATHRLGDLGCPTLILIGDNDSGRSNHLAQAHSLKERIRNAELKLLKGQSHGFFWQAPEETNQTILQWVSAHSSK